MKGKLKPREQGDAGELSAMEWLASQGASIFVPVGHSPDVDLIASFEGRLIRVEVKTSTCERNGRWIVLISTRGGNQSWSGLVKYFDPARCDFLFVLVGDGRRWMIPTPALECESGLSLGGKKYAEFEVDRGAPLRTKPSLESPPTRGSSGDGESGRSVKSVATPEWVRIPPPPSNSSGQLGPRACGRSLRYQRTTISPQHQITVPSVPFADAGLCVGDRIHAAADGPGRVILERIDPPVANNLPLNGDLQPEP